MEAHTKSSFPVSNYERNDQKTSPTDEEPCPVRIARGKMPERVNKLILFLYGQKLNLTFLLLVFHAKAHFCTSSYASRIHNAMPRVKCGQGQAVMRPDERDYNESE